LNKRGSGSTLSIGGLSTGKTIRDIVPFLVPPFEFITKFP